MDEAPVGIAARSVMPTGFPLRLIRSARAGCGPPDEEGSVDPLLQCDGADRVAYVGCGAFARDGAGCGG